MSGTVLSYWEKLKMINQRLVRERGMNRQNIEYFLGSENTLYEIIMVDTSMSLCVHPSP